MRRERESERERERERERDRSVALIITWRNKLKLWLFIVWVNRKIVQMQRTAWGCFELY